MKIKLTLALLIASLLSTAAAFATADPWDPSRCVNGTSSIVYVNVINNSSALQQVQSSQCTRCGVSLMTSAPQTLDIFPGDTESFETCGYHPGYQIENDDYMSIAPYGSSSPIMQGILDYDNGASGYVILTIPTSPYKIIINPNGTGGSGGNYIAYQTIFIEISQ